MWIRHFEGPTQGHGHWDEQIDPGGDSLAALANAAVHGSAHMVALIGPYYDLLCYVGVDTDWLIRLGPPPTEIKDTS